MESSRLRTQREAYFWDPAGSMRAVLCVCLGRGCQGPLVQPAGSPGTSSKRQQHLLVAPLLCSAASPALYT